MNASIARFELKPVPVGRLFRELHAELIALLSGLRSQDWDRAATPGWTVRDVVAHMLDLDIRRIGIDRDGHAPPPPAAPITGYGHLVAYLDALNGAWVAAARRVSPRILIELLETTGPELARLMEQHDPHAAATYPVAWAGQEASPMWLDVGREFVERWHHQDQIREAVGAPPLAPVHMLAPVLAISLLALPHAYAGTDRPDATALELHADGPASGTWTLRRNGDAWQLHEGAAGGDPACTVTADGLLLARLLLHRLPRGSGATGFDIRGDASLAEPLLAARAVMV